MTGVDSCSAMSSQATTQLHLDNIKKIQTSPGSSSRRLAPGAQGQRGVPSGLILRGITFEIPRRSTQKHHPASRDNCTKNRQHGECHAMLAVCVSYLWR